MTISVVGSPTTSGTTTIAVPTGVADGDLLLCCAGRYGGTMPEIGGSWTELAATAAGPYTASKLWWRIAASEPANYSVTNAEAIAMVALRGIRQDAPIHASDTANTLTSPSVTTTVDGCWILRWASAALVTAYDFAASTELFDCRNGCYDRLGMAYEVQGTAGACGASVITPTIYAVLGQAISATIAIEPAASGTPAILGLPYGTAAELDAHTPDQCELLYDTTNDAVRFGDGATAGGVVLARAVHTHAHDSTRQMIMTIQDDVEVVQGVLRFPNHLGFDLTLTDVHLDIDTAPTGADLIVDIHKGGTTIFTTQSNRPQIADGTNAGSSSTIEVATLADGEYYTLEVDQVGSTVAGANLTVTLVFTEAA